MSNDKQCACGTAPKLIFPCSGAADVGEIADRAARRLSKEGAGKMYCLAGVGGHIEDMLLNVQAAGDFGLGYQGFVAACALPGTGARWSSVYAGTAQVAADSILFQLEPPYDTLHFVGHRTGAGTWTTIVPQLPSAQGPPVALGFQYVRPL